MEDVETAAYLQDSPSAHLVDTSLEGLQQSECCSLRSLLLSSSDGQDQACEHVCNPSQRLSLRQPRVPAEASLSPASSESDFKLALHAAAFKGRGDLLGYLLAAGSEVNGTDCDGCTPLHLAVKRMRLSPSMSGGSGDDAWDEKDIVQLLLSYGANVNATNSGKKTALHYAASVGKKDVVELLLDHGAESWHRDEDGASALDLARAAGHTEVIPPLCKAEEKIFQRLEMLEALCMQLQRGQSQAQEEFNRRMEALERAVYRSTGGRGEEAD